MSQGKKLVEQLIKAVDAYATAVEYPCSLEYEEQCKTDKETAERELVAYIVKLEAPNEAT